MLEPIFKTLHIMKIKATKVMAEYINDLAKENNLNLKAIPTLVGSEQIGIDELLYAEDYGDVDRYHCYITHQFNPHRVFLIHLNTNNYGDD